MCWPYFYTYLIAHKSSVQRLNQISLILTKNEETDGWD